MKHTIEIQNQLHYSYLDDRNIVDLIKAVREGVKYKFFSTIVKNSPFSMQEWSVYLNMSIRSIQRYNKEKKTFDRMQSEKILEIAIIYNKGISVFGEKKKFDLWLDSSNIALGGIKPKELLDSSFGVNMLMDELGRIEHGILA